jgi:hypothetical protein
MWPPDSEEPREPTGGTSKPCDAAAIVPFLLLLAIAIVLAVHLGTVVAALYEVAIRRDAIVLLVLRDLSLGVMVASLGFLLVALLRDPGRRWRIAAVAILLINSVCFGVFAQARADETRRRVVGDNLRNLARALLEYEREHGWDVPTAPDMQLYDFRADKRLSPDPLPREEGTRMHGVMPKQDLHETPSP